jgi:hypothetical protein
LNVFGDNDVALPMYESSGYEVAAIQMQKTLVDSESSGLTRSGLNPPAGTVSRTAGSADDARSARL